MGPTLGGTSASWYGHGGLGSVEMRLCEEPISSSGASVSIHFHPNLMIRIHLHPADFSESFEKYGMIAASCFFCAPAIRARDSKSMFFTSSPTIAGPPTPLSPPRLLTEKQNPKLHAKRKTKTQKPRNQQFRHNQHSQPQTLKLPNAQNPLTPNPEQP